ncbi:hypothetical protein [Streptomyces pseudovenezuelae]|uniref:hypothetical protein n=1 Tax=Streptomyces pseudovenezuelae TaxID=67350 RepID=UPI002E81195D|nr:hypothetical protein [Streptomyces pseudovenezuelae]WUA86071.1 hypothetical protein OHO81_01725 [Streptomyces pseudovenezuelae]
MPHFLLTVTASRRTNLGLQVEPAVRIRELASRVKDADVPMPGDRLLLRRPDTGTWWIAPLASFGLEAWQKDGLAYTRSDPADPEFTLAIGGRGGPEALPVGTEIWLDDNAPTRGHRTNGWRRIIADIASGDWHQAAPDAVDTTITDR